MLFATTLFEKGKILFLINFNEYSYQEVDKSNSPSTSRNSPERDSIQHEDLEPETGYSSQEEIGPEAVQRHGIIASEAIDQNHDKCNPDLLEDHHEQEVVRNLNNSTHMK